MHEMSLAEGILQIVEDAASAQGFRRVTQVRLEIGALAGVEVEALRFCMDLVLKGSLAEGAELVLDRLPGAGYCLGCGERVEIGALYDPCPSCGGFQVQPTGGTEKRVKDLLVD
jgi:hydrogenase nickel incorporation protein HypA/HybF